MSKIKLFFIPHAGGSAMGYMTMKRFLDTDIIEPIPIELAGRGQRIKEACFQDVLSCVKDLYSKIEEQIVDCKYAFFGHSLGSLLTYELVQYIAECNKPLPVCVICSGRVAPDYNIAGPILRGLDDETFISKFSKLQATPMEHFQDKRIWELMLPILRADIEMAEEYRYERKSPLKCDVYAFYGKDDPLCYEEGMNGWSESSEKNVEIKRFEGSHFYYNDNKELLGDTLNKILIKY